MKGLKSIIERFDAMHNKRNTVEFHDIGNEAFSWKPDVGYVRTRCPYVKINGVRHYVLSKTLSKFKNRCGKDYVESIEYFAVKVLIEKSIPNDGYFSE